MGGMETASLDADHPASHFRCEPDCPCTCAARDAYEANAGTLCRNCWGVIERKRVHRFETVYQGGGFTLMTSKWDDLGPAAAPSR